MATGHDARDPAAVGALPVGRVIARGIRVTGKILPIAGAATLAGGLATGLASGMLLDPAADPLQFNWGGFALVMLIHFAVFAPIGAAITSAVGDAEQIGAADAGRAIRLAMSRGPLLLVATLLYTFAMGLGLALLIVPGLLVATIYWMIGPALVLEGAGLPDAFRRSAALTKGQRWRVFAVLAVTGLVNGAITNGVDVAIGLLGMLQTTIGPVISATVSAAVIVVLTAINTVTFLELRRIAEGMDPAVAGEVFA